MFHDIYLLLSLQTSKTLGKNVHKDAEDGKNNFFYATAFLCWPRLSEIINILTFLKFSNNVFFCCEDICTKRHRNFAFYPFNVDEHTSHYV